MIQKILLEFDDLHWNGPTNCLEIAKDLIAKFPPIILNFFVPAKMDGVRLSDNESWCNELRELIERGSIELGVHGLEHTQEEMKYLSYGEAFAKLQEAEAIFLEAKLPFTKVFRGPHWSLNKNTLAALINRGYSHVYSHVDYQLLTNQFKELIGIVYYNWNLKDEYGIFENSPTSDIVVGHGHASQVCNNGIGESYDRIYRALQSNSFEFLRLSDYA